jgi:hypothetical protein
VCTLRKNISMLSGSTRPSRRFRVDLCEASDASMVAAGSVQLSRGTLGTIYDRFTLRGTVCQPYHSGYDHHVCMHKVNCACVVGPQKPTGRIWGGGHFCLQRQCAATHTHARAHATTSMQTCCMGVRRPRLYAICDIRWAMNLSAPSCQLHSLARGDASCRSTLSANTFVSYALNQALCFGLRPHHHPIVVAFRLGGHASLTFCKITDIYWRACVHSTMLAVFVKHTHAHIVFFLRPFYPFRQSAG